MQNEHSVNHSPLGDQAGNISPPPLEPYLTIQDVVDLQQVNARTIRRDIRDGKLRTTNVRSTIRITRADFENYRAELERVSKAHERKSDK